jgi:thiol-disulfide isomerase/thioredoxin
MTALGERVVSSILKENESMNVVGEDRIELRSRRWSKRWSGFVATACLGLWLTGCAGESGSRHADGPDGEPAEEQDEPRPARSRRSSRSSSRERASTRERASDEGTGSESSGKGGGGAIGRQLPDIRLSALKGSKGVRLGDFRGKVVLLDVWASWCAPCKQELPMLDDMAGRLRGRGIEIVAVSVDDSREDAEEFLRSRKNWSLRLAHDPDGKLPSKLNPPKMPSSYFIDRGGVIRQVNAGFEHGDERKIESRLLALAQEG